MSNNLFRSNYDVSTNLVMETNISGNCFMYIEWKFIGKLHIWFNNSIILIGWALLSAREREGGEKEKEERGDVKY